MRWAGRIAPGSGAGEAGHLAAWRRPNATAEAKVRESCLLRPVRSLGFTVSGPPATAGCGAAPTRWATDAGSAAAFDTVLESKPFPSGMAADPGVVSRPAQAMSAADVEMAARRRGDRIIWQS